MIMQTMQVYRVWCDVGEGPDDAANVHAYTAEDAAVQYGERYFGNTFAVEIGAGLLPRFPIEVTVESTTSERSVFHVYCTMRVQARQV